MKITNPKIAEIIQRALAKAKEVDDAAIAEAIEIAAEEISE